MHNEQEEGKITQGLVSVINRLMFIVVVLVITIVAIPFILYYTGKPGKSVEQTQDATAQPGTPKADAGNYWTAPDISTIPDAKQKEQVTYGQELIAHTSRYLGPNGSVMQISNGMNCQNCHLQAGTVVFGNNYGSVASLYPKFRARSGGVEDIYKRVNDCFERSLNGKALPKTSKEMQAIVSYINFVGSNVEKGKKAEGSGFKDLAWLDRAASPENGMSVYTAKCQSCHQANGEGVFTLDKTEYTYPALWGKNSFNDGAGLYRISNFAKYIKYNMPLGVTHQNPQLTDEEAWDVAAYVNSRQRPDRDLSADWPNIAGKPVDHPFGPYADSIPEIQHKFGPFGPIAEAKAKAKKK